MKTATSNLARGYGLLRPSWNPTKRNSGWGPGLGELPKIWSFPFNISATAEASDFKFGTQLGFAKAHYKITPRGKSGHGYNIAGASDFKFLHAARVCKVPWKIIRRRKDKRGPGLGVLTQIWGFPSIFTQWLKLATSNFTQLGFAKTHHKTRPWGKVGVALGYGSSQIFGVPL